MNTFTLEDLGALVSDDWEAYLPFHERRADGLWVKPLDAVEKRICLFPGERRIRMAHPTAAASSVPALGRTFTLAEFLDFAQQPNGFLEEAIGEDHLEYLATNERRAYELGVALAERLGFAGPANRHVGGDVAARSDAGSEGATTAPSVSPIVPFQRQPAQERLILDALEALGQDPLHVPDNRGARGIRAKVWALVSEHKQIFVSQGTFEKAWQRLRDAGHIKNE